MSSSTRSGVRTARDTDAQKLAVGLGVKSSRPLGWLSYPVYLFQSIFDPTVSDSLSGTIRSSSCRNVLAIQSFWRGGLNVIVGTTCVIRPGLRRAPSPQVNWLWSPSQ